MVLGVRQSIIKYLQCFLPLALAVFARNVLLFAGGSSEIELDGLASQKDIYIYIVKNSEKSIAFLFFVSVLEMCMV